MSDDIGKRLTPKEINERMDAHWERYFAHWKSLKPDFDRDMMQYELLWFRENDKLDEAFSIIPYGAEMVPRVKRLYQACDFDEPLHDMTLEERLAHIYCPDEEILGIARDLHTKLGAALGRPVDKDQVELIRCDNPSWHQERYPDQGDGDPTELLVADVLEGLEELVDEKIPDLWATRLFLSEPLYGILTSYVGVGYATWPMFANRVSFDDPFEPWCRLYMRYVELSYTASGNMLVFAWNRPTGVS